MQGGKVMEDVRKIITENLNELIKRKNIKSVDLAEQLGVSKSAVSHWLAGDNSPNIELLAKICQIYGVKLSEMLNEKIETSYAEKEMLKKYRSLDEYGQEAVDKVLDVEHRRCTYEEDGNNIIELSFSELKASAGMGEWLDEEQFSTIQVINTPEARKADIVIQVDGRSMEPKFSDGDKVLVRLQPAVEVGEIGIFIMDNQGYIKQYAEDRLISLNPEYDDVYPSKYDGTKCIGKVLGKAVEAE